MVHRQPFQPSDATATHQGSGPARGPTGPQPKPGCRKDAPSIHKRKSKRGLQPRPGARGHGRVRVSQPRPRARPVAGLTGSSRVLMCSSRCSDHEQACAASPWRGPDSRSCASPGALPPNSAAGSRQRPDDASGCRPRLSGNMPVAPARPRHFGMPRPTPISPVMLTCPTAHARRSIHLVGRIPGETDHRFARSSRRGRLIELTVAQVSGQVFAPIPGCEHRLPEKSLQRGPAK
jgi:hypothetical protein